MSQIISTIIAPASSPARAGVILIRVSGPNSAKLVETLTLKPPPSPRKAILRGIYDKSGDLIDKALVVFFKAPNSFTGEDIAEFSIHGSRAVLSAFIRAALDTGLCELAKAGEFTRRAFENSKMDLSAAEGLADLIDAETEAQRKQALRQMQGELGELAQTWRGELIDVIAHLEAYIDFPDEDLPDGLREKSARILDGLIHRLGKHIDDSAYAQRVRDGYFVAIIGAPNAGKSSLLNALARKDAAIVSPIAGTTRDIIETSLIIAGHLFYICDTAGLREAKDEIENLGIERALKRADSSDLRIGLVTKEDELSAILEYLVAGDILALSKSDLNEADQFEVWKKILHISEQKGFSALQLSSKTGDGISDLEQKLANIALEAHEALEAAPITRARHEEALKQALKALENANFYNDAPPELVIEDLRLAARHLGSISGIIGVEDVLDKIFSSFCIGK